MKNCRGVAKSWQKYIDQNNFSWTEIVKIPKILPRGDTYQHLAAKTGHYEMFEKMIEDEVIKNPKDACSKTPFHIACQFGQSTIASMIIQKSTKLNFDLNAKARFGITAFHLACTLWSSKGSENLSSKF